MGETTSGDGGAVAGRHSGGGGHGKSLASAKGPAPAAVSAISPVIESALIERARSGDADAMDRLLLAHQDAVYRTALRLLGNAEEAADCAQDVFVAAFRRIGQFRGESKFATWLYRITVNLVRNRWRDASRRPRTVGFEELSAAGGASAGAAGHGGEAESAPAFDPADPGRSPRERAEAAELHAALLAAIEKLPEPYREVVVLRHLRDLPYEEIAEALELELGTVKSRLARSRDLLRDLLAPVLEGRGSGGGAAR